MIFIAKKWDLKQGCYQDLVVLKNSEFRVNTKFFTSGHLASNCLGAFRARFQWARAQAKPLKQLKLSLVQFANASQQGCAVAAKSSWKAKCLDGTHPAMRPVILAQPRSLPTECHGHVKRRPWAAPTTARSLASYQTFKWFSCCPQSLATYFCGTYNSGLFRRPLLVKPQSRWTRTSVQEI